MGKGWLDIDIYDLSKDKQIMTVLLDPTELSKQNESIKLLVQKLQDE
ncbi:TPA: hypothetical protein G9F27_004683 [Salmonella enterica]|uniref:Uncharacterized protein n=1 Tax=Salmonella enterica TaxID=28901 RepID=A0A743PDM1_SALER|nr:hypothetical protein [Salmonella enterica]